MRRGRRLIRAADLHRGALGHCREGSGGTSCRRGAVRPPARTGRASFGEPGDCGRQSAADTGDEMKNRFESMLN